MDLDEPKNAPATEYSKQFLQGMLDRMGMSYAAYGKVSEAYPDFVNALDSLVLRIKKYKETKNTEFLIDVANFAMIEFMYPSIEDAKFSPTDRKDSPGRIWHGSRIGNQNRNDDK